MPIPTAVQRKNGQNHAGNLKYVYMEHKKNKVHPHHIRLPHCRLEFGSQKPDPYASPKNGPPHHVSDSKVHGANMGPIWGRQDPGGPHVGPMNFAI